MAPRTTRTAGRTLLNEPVSDISHALMGLAMALMVSPFGDTIPAPLGVLVFGVLAGWFATILCHDGVTSCAGTGERGGRGGRERGPGGPLSGLGGRDRHGGFNLHHLAGCIAMIFMFATGHGAGAAAVSASPVAGPGLAGHHELAPLTSVSWLFGLYFLVAATSLGFRVGEPAIRVTYRAAVPAGAGSLAGDVSPATPAKPTLAGDVSPATPAKPTLAGDVSPATPAKPAPPPAARPAPSRLLSSPAGLCASEVILSGGMAVMFFASL